MGKVVLADEGFADDVGICKAGVRVGSQVRKWKGFVLGYLEEGVGRVGKEG